MGEAMAYNQPGTEAAEYSPTTGLDWYKLARVEIGDYPLMAVDPALFGRALCINIPLPSYIVTAELMPRILTPPYLTAHYMETVRDFEWKCYDAMPKHIRRAFSESTDGFALARLMVYVACKRGWDVVEKGIILGNVRAQIEYEIDAENGFR